MNTVKIRLSKPMKLFLLAVILFPAVLVAQTAQPLPRFPVGAIQPGQPPVPSDTLPDNYRVTLIITDKDGQPAEVSVVIASTRFHTLLGEQGLDFDGVLTVEESGSVHIQYALGWATSFQNANGTTDSRQSTTTGSVRMKLGEEIQILRAGPRVAKLSINKLEASKSK